MTKTIPITGAAGGMRRAVIELFTEKIGKSSALTETNKDSPLLKIVKVMLASHNFNLSPASWERVHGNTTNNLVEGLGMESKK